MLYIFMGQSCTGKSTAADKLKNLINAEVFSGKDYLKMAKNENDAWILFYKKLSQAAEQKNPYEGTIIYIITETEHLKRLNLIEGACKIKFTASLNIIKSRFAQRMRGNLPKPVEKMLEKQYAEWEIINGDMNVDTTENYNLEEIATLIISL